MSQKYVGKKDTSKNAQTKIYDEYNHKLFIIPWTARYDIASYLFGTHSSHLQLLMLFNSYLERNVGARKWFGSLIKACLRLYA